MKKHIKGLIISLSVIAALIIATVVMMNYTPERMEHHNEDRAERQLVYKNDNADRIKVTSERGELEVVKDGGVWTIAGVDKDDINSMQLDLFISEATEYDSRTVVENPEISEYGLDNPSVTVEISSGDVTDTITIGSHSAVEKAYFAYVNGVVFTMDEPQYRTIVSAETDFTSFRRLSVDPNNITGIKIERGNEIIDLYIIDLKRMEGTVWYMRSPYEAMASDDYIDANILEQLGAVSLSNMSDEFGEEKAKLTITEGDKTYELKVSDPDGGSVNIEYNGKLYHESADLFAFLDAPLYSYVSKLTSYKHILDIDSVTLEYDGVSHIIERKNSDATEFAADGVKADISLTKKIYQAIIGITANAFYNNEPLGDTIMKITYKGGTDEIIEFKSVNEYTAAAVKNGNTMFTVSTADIEKLKDSVNEYFNLINK